MDETITSGIEYIDNELGGGFPLASLIGTFGFYGDLENLLLLNFLRSGFESDERVLYVSSFDSEFVFWEKAKQWGIEPKDSFFLYKIPDTSLGNFPGITREISKIIEENRITRIAIELTPLLQFNDPRSVFVSIARLKDLIWRLKIVGLLSITKGSTIPEVKVTLQSILDGIIDILPSNEPALSTALMKITKMKNSLPMTDYKGFKIENATLVFLE